MSKFWIQAVLRCFVAIGDVTGGVMSHRYSVAVQVVKQTLDDFIGIPFAGEGTMDEVHTQGAHSFLLQLSCVI